jgi:hypothetical protein
MIPLYGFLEGDTLGLLILAQPDMTLEQLARQLKAAARLRADPGEQVRVLLRGVERNLSLTVAQVGLGPLERFDVRAAGGTWHSSVR